MTTPISKIRRQILKQRGVELAPHTKEPLQYADAPAPYHKTPLMKFIELKFQDKIENLIFNGTVREVGKRFGVDYSTISKWRKLISDAKFFSQFEEATNEQSNKTEGP